jgi:hypothetical protein
MPHLPRAVVLAGLAALAAARGATADPTLALAEPAVRVHHERDTAVAVLLVRAEGLSEEQMKGPGVTVTDVGSPDAPSTHVREASKDEVERGKTSRAWLVRVTVEGLTPRTSQRRYLRLSLGTLESVVAYTLSDVVPATFTWTVTEPTSPWLVWRGIAESTRATGVTVTTADGTATGLRLAHASLRDAAASHEIGLGDLELCGTDSGECGSPSPVDPQSNRTFWLRLKTWPHGKYTGTVALAVDERPELKTVNVNVHASSWMAVAFGLLLLALGTAVGWSVNVWARGRVARLEAQMAAAAVSDRAAALARGLDEAPHELKGRTATMRRVLVGVQESLTVESLDKAKLLHPVVPWALRTATDTAALLKDHLTAKSNVLAGLQILLDKGLRPWWVRWLRAAEGSSDRAHLAEAIERLDAQSVDAGDETKAAEILRTVAAQLASDLGQQGDAAGRAPEPRAERDLLTWQMTRVQEYAWLVWGLVTVLTGAAALVLPNAGFGTAQDLLLCFFWGMGLPVAVDRLQSLGPGGVASSIGVTLPKASS